MAMKVIGVSNVVVVVGRGMTASLSALSFSLKVVNDASKNQRNKHSIIKSSPSSTSSTSSMHLSSLPAKIDETKKSSESQKTCSSVSPCSALNQGNAIGIIGGVSVLSTLIFLEKLVWWSSRNGGESVPFIVCSDPMLSQEAHKPSVAMTGTSFYSPYSYNSGNAVLKGLDQNGVVENLRHKRMFLEDGGAQCIIMPCHLCHAWYGEISKGCKLPFLHVADCVSRELKEARFKPLEAGSGVKIGVIATDATLMARVYQEKLQNQGFEVVLPDKATMEHIINPAITSLKRKDKEGAQNLLRIAIQVLLVRAVNTVILASDELQGLLPFDDPLSKKCIDPMDALARSAVTWAKSAKLSKKTL